MRQPNPERGLFMDIQKNNLWTFLTKKTKIHDDYKTNGCSPMLNYTPTVRNNV